MTERNGKRFYSALTPKNVCSCQGKLVFYLTIKVVKKDIYLGFYSIASLLFNSYESATRAIVCKAR